MSFQELGIADDMIGLVSLNETIIADTFISSFGASIGLYILTFITIGTGLCLAKFIRTFLSIITIFTIANFCITIVMFTTSIELMRDIERLANDIR